MRLQDDNIYEFTLYTVILPLQQSGASTAKNIHLNKLNLRKALDLQIDKIQANKKAASYNTCAAFKTHTAKTENTARYRNGATGPSRLTFPKTKKKENILSKNVWVKFG